MRPNRASWAVGFACWAWAAGARAGVCDDPAAAWSLVRRASTAMETGQFAPVHTEVVQLSQCPPPQPKNDLIARAQDESKLLLLQLLVQDTHGRFDAIPRVPATADRAAFDRFMQRVTPGISELVTFIDDLSHTDVGVHGQPGAAEINYSVRVDALAAVAGLYVRLAQTAEAFPVPADIRRDAALLDAYRGVLDGMVGKIYQHASDFYLGTRAAVLNHPIEPRAARILRAMLEIRGAPVDPPATQTSGQINAALRNPSVPTLVRAAMVSAAGTMEQCYQQGLAANPSMRGRVVYHLEIGAAGAVARLAVKTTDPALVPIDPCLQGAIHAVKFDGVPSGTAIDYPLDFALP